MSGPADALRRGFQAEGTASAKCLRLACSEAEGVSSGWEARPGLVGLGFALRLEHEKVLSGEARTDIHTNSTALLLL